MAIKNTDRVARANYKKKVEKLQVELYPTDEDIKDRLAKRVEAGEPKASYIKRLIREDIEKASAEVVLKKIEEKLREEQMKDIAKQPRISKERREELQALLDAGAKLSDLFKPKK